MKICQIFISIFLLCLVSFNKPVALYSATGPFLVYNHSSGMFATFASILGALDFYEQGDYEGIKVDLDSGAYLDPMLGSNWWEYFFEPINIGGKSGQKHNFTLYEHCLFVGNAYNMPRRKAFKLIQRYIHVKSEIQEEVDSFVSKNFENRFTIGIHHRGTDKKMEIPIVSYEKTSQALNGVIQQLPVEQRDILKIYIATDDQHFLNYMLSLYPSQIIYNDFVRSDDHTPIHYGNDSKYQSIYQKGKEALLDCLLLSKCDILIRPHSTLSIISGHFNPNMPVIVLSGEN